MRARDVHVYCDNVVAGIATKLHHLSIPLRTGIGAITQWGNHIIQGSVGVSRSVLNSSSSSSSSSSPADPLRVLAVLNLY